MQNFNAKGALHPLCYAPFPSHRSTPMTSTDTEAQAEADARARIAARRAQNEADEAWLAEQAALAQKEEKARVAAVLSASPPLRWEVPTRYILYITNCQCGHCGRKSSTSRLQEYLPRPEGLNVFRPQDTSFQTYTLWDVEVVDHIINVATPFCKDCIATAPRRPVPVFANDLRGPMKSSNLTVPGFEPSPKPKAPPVKPLSLDDL